MTNEEIKAGNVDRVLREAIDCFIKYGIDNTTLSSIAKRAGVSYRSIQRYFESKDEFILTVLVLFLEESIVLLNSMFLKEQKRISTGIEQIEALIDLQYDFSRTHEKNLILLSEMQIYFCRNNVEDKMIYEHIVAIDRIRVIWKKALLKGQNDGTIRKDIDSKILEEAISLFVSAIMQHLAVNHKDFDVDSGNGFDAELDICKQMILNYIKIK